jgi:hypothetical protein
MPTVKFMEKYGDQVRERYMLPTEEELELLDSERETSPDPLGQQEPENTEPRNPVVVYQQPSLQEVQPMEDIDV